MKYRAAEAVRDAATIGVNERESPGFMDSGVVAFETDQRRKAAPMPWQNPDDSAIAAILRDTRRIALVGASANAARPSASVLRWLLGRGYDVTAINPGLSGTLFGAPVAARLADLPVPVDMVDVFRNSEAAGAVVDEVLALPWRPKVIWMQLGVVNPEAAARAEAMGIAVVTDRCPVIEAGRLDL